VVRGTNFRAANPIGFATARARDEPPTDGGLKEARFLAGGVRFGSAIKLN
jgi:hypothetical protein